MRSLLAAVAGASALVIASCADTPMSVPTGPASAPAPSASSSFDGTWKIDVQIDHCYERNCFPGIGKTRTVLVRLVTTPWSVEGIFVTAPAVVITGGIAAGQIDLRSGAKSPLPGVAGSYDIEFATLKASLSEQGLSGSLDYKLHSYSTSIDTSPVGFGGPILHAERLDTGVGDSFTGVWSGQAAIKSCSSVSFPFCWPDNPRLLMDVSIQLVQMGGTVSGTVTLDDRVVPIKGEATGTSLVLTESLPSTGPATTITFLSATRDKLGRLQGKFEYRTFVGGVLRTSYDDVDLWSVALR